MISNIIKKNQVFFKYALVWVSSTFVDIFSLYLLVDIFNFELYFSVFIAFLLAVINWFVFNKIWTFEDKSKKYKRQFLKFFIVSVFWLTLTLSLMYFFVDVLNIYYLLSKAFTSLIVLFWNYIANKLWTFNKSENEIIIKEPKKKLWFKIFNNSSSI